MYLANGTERDHKLTMVLLVWHGTLQTAPSSFHELIIAQQLFFGFIIDRIGRRAGVVIATTFLIVGIIIATAAHGTSDYGMFWTMIVGRGIGGFGAGGKLSCSSQESFSA